MNREMIGGLLRAAGHDVALRKAGRTQHRSHHSRPLPPDPDGCPSCPESDGLEATDRYFFFFRSLPGPSGQVPILALTAYVLPVKIAQCHDAGMDGYVASLSNTRHWSVRSMRPWRAVGRAGAGVAPQRRVGPPGSIAGGSRLPFGICRPTRHR